ncbi:scramblase [Nitzschia inconspicua]|uniref:Phospholipid scramblase n=1 Tax=Nitzschia inconspicua TaxID=303405 RepID=A0A9K3L239_9STRA|nr:scramblase [Nitzschia inconspicua]
MGETMDRGDGLLASKLQNCEKLEIRQGRRGWLQECLCCVTKSSFSYYNGEKEIAQSKEEFSFLCRCCFAPDHAFDMTVHPVEGGDGFLEINRPCKICPAPLKCFCHSEATIFSGEHDLGEIRETCWWSVPQFKVYDHNEEEVYIIQPPTCCDGMCVDCFSEGCPCPHGCCIIPCNIYAGHTPVTNSTEPVGRMAKIPKKSFCDTYNETNYYVVEFPEGASVNHKGLLAGASLLINAVYFENSE